jgi:hypothetical protein
MFEDFMACFIVSLWSVTTLSYLTSWVGSIIKGQVDGFDFLGLTVLTTIALFVYYEAVRKEKK